MAIEIRKVVHEGSGSLPQHVVQVDGIFQIGVGLGLLFGSKSVPGWLNTSTAIVLTAAVVALSSGVLTLYLAQQRLDARLLRIGAISNLVGVVVVGTILALDWSALLNEGRWLLALLAAAFLFLGIAEFYVHRYVA